MQEEVTFFSYNKKSDWEKGIAYNLHLADSGLHIEQVQRFGWVSNLHLASLDGPGPLRDLAFGTDDKFLLLDGVANVWQYDEDHDHLDLIFRPQHQLFTAESMLGAVRDTLFVVDPAGERRVAGYLQSSGQLVWEYNEWLGTTIEPLTLATDRQEHLYVLFPFGDKLVLVKWNTDGVVKFAAPLPELTEDEVALQNLIRNRFFLCVAPKSDPTAEDLLYLLDTRNNQVYLYKTQGSEQGGWQAVLQMTYSLLIPFTPSGFGLDGQRHLYIGDSRSEDPDGVNPRFVLHYGADGAYIGTVAGYQGKVDKMLLDPIDDRLCLWNIADNQITKLEMDRRTQRWGDQGYRGLLLLPALDSTERETLWHKITLDADYPDETQLHVSFYASDRTEVIIDGKLRVLDSYLLDDTIRLADKLSKLNHLWSKPIINPHDALLFEAKGRYLWLKIEVDGSEKFTPIVRKFRAYFPRTSYLSYLPAVYQEDEGSRYFLERYLSLFGTLLGEMEEQIAGISRFFDPDVVSGEYLRWLSTWVAIAADDNWTEEQTRHLLKRSPELYRKRGTREGLAELIEIFIGDKPLIVEFFQYKNLIEKAEIKAYMQQLYGLDPYCFCVLIKPNLIQTEQQRMLIERILNAEKPAFTEAKLVVLEKLIYMGSHSYIGINTFLSEPSLLLLDDKSTMPYQTVLIDVDRDNRIGLHTRLGLNSELE